MTETTDMETIALLRTTSTATITTQLFKRGLRNCFIEGARRMAGTATMVGPAYTLRNIPAREDIDLIETLGDPSHPQRRSIETVPAGHVLVIDCRGDASAACAGEILVARLAARGVAGLVSDGGLRDSGPISAGALPVFAAAASAPLNLVRHHAVEAQVPIGCGGVAVYPGDLLVGDADGVAVIPRALAAEVARDAAAQERLEAFVLLRIQAGAALPGTYPPDADTRAAFEVWEREQGQGAALDPQGDSSP